MDRDPEAAHRAAALSDEFGEAFRFVQGNFTDASSPFEALGAGRAPLDGAFLDLGLSSFQLADPGRGFSFANDGPLDMRFDPSRGPSAADVVNRYPEARLKGVIRELGDEPWAGLIAAAIVRRRRRQPFRTTRELAELVGGVIPRARWPRRVDPATRTFQAIRVEVNDEIGSLRSGLEEIVRLLKPGGRLGVIAFHSLEDKAVKDFLNVEARDCICPPQQPVCTCGHTASVIIHPPHPQRPGKDEVEANPRSRSARLRGAFRLPLPEGSPLLHPTRGRYRPPTGLRRQRRNDRSKTE
ncbi:MAG: rRNA (cytosine1402-N4)-methyltransferase [Chloroflexota bacterium]|jgi:16S rRNA (cytosine1402-N4)-methyltransferase|nr:rRNA (cytosine1402-N4)-methyltransferase [Chloroflexota bacterium]